MVSTPRISVRRVELRADDCHPRLPIRAHDATIDWATLITARVTADVDGETAEGFAADVLMPGGTDRDSSNAPREDVTQFARSARDAGWAFEGAGKGTVFELWARANREHLATTPDPDVHEFGVGLSERALMDAVCRATTFSFYSAMRRNVFGFVPAEMLPDLEGWNPSASLPPAPPKRMLVRHTIRLDDPLGPDDLADPWRVEDGLPRTLVEEVERYRLSRFGVELSGVRDADADRLHRIDDVLEPRCGTDFGIALDARRKYSDLDELRALLDDLPPAFAQRIACLVRPVSRAAFRQTPVGDLPVDVVLDDADGGIEACTQGLPLGYRGIPNNSNRGIFRSLAHRGLCELHPGVFQFSRDPMSLPAVGLQQDLANAGALGLTEVEHSSHRYFFGLGHLPFEEARAALDAHPDLYEELDTGIFLRIRNGCVALGSLRCTGFAVASALDFEARTPLEDWSPPTGARKV